MSAARDALLFLLEQCRPGQSLEVFEDVRARDRCLIFARALERCGYECEVVSCDLRVALPGMIQSPAMAIGIRIDQEIFGAEGDAGSSAVIAAVGRSVYATYGIPRERFTVSSVSVVKPWGKSARVVENAVLLMRDKTPHPAGKTLHDLSTLAFSVLQARELEARAAHPAAASRPSRL